MTERCDSEFLKKKKHNQTQPNANKPNILPMYYSV